MRWSYSSTNIRNSCPKQFVLAHKIAWHIGKPIKRKAFELKNMVNFEMWQGKIVDRVIEKYLIPNLKMGYFVDYPMIADKAISLAQKQYEFSKSHRYRELSKSKAGDSYCILEVHELQLPYTKEEIQIVFNTIRQCILNISDIVMPKNDIKLVELLARKPSTLEANINGENSESKLKIRYKFENGFVFPQMDLVQFLPKNVIIYDWKVSNSLSLDASQQLSTYGVVIYDYLKTKGGYRTCRRAVDYKNIHLLEVNLLKKETKKREFDLDIANQMLDYIYLSNQDMELTIDNKDWSNIDLSEIPRTENSNTCAMCRFRTLCSFLITNNYSYEQKKYTKFLQNPRFIEV